MQLSAPTFSEYPSERRVSCTPRNHKFTSSHECTTHTQYGIHICTPHLYCRSTAWRRGFLMANSKEDQHARCKLAHAITITRHRPISFIHAHSRVVHEMAREPGGAPLAKSGVLIALTNLALFTEHHGTCIEGMRVKALLAGLPHCHQSDSMSSCYSAALCASPC